MTVILSLSLKKKHIEVFKASLKFLECLIQISYLQTLMQLCKLHRQPKAKTRLQNASFCKLSKKILRQNKLRVLF